MPVVQTIDGTHEFEALADEWRELLADSGADPLFLSWEWLFTWWRMLGGRRALRLLTVRDGGRLVAVVPLVLRGRAMRRLQPFEVLEFLGTGAAGSDYLDFIVRTGHEGDVLRALHKHLVDSRYSLELSHTTGDASSSSRLAQRLAGAGWARVDEAVEVCPYIPFTGHDWDRYLETLGSSHRYNVRRRFRKLDKAFEVHFERAVDESTCRRFLEDLVRLHRMRRDTLGGSDGLDDERMVAFHAAFTELALARGWLRLHRLTLDGVAVAAVYGFRVGPKFYFYQSGFDPAYGKHSVGLLVLAHSIKAALEEGAAEYDLLHGNERYKYHWTSSERALTRHHLYPPHARGVVAHRLFGLKRQLKTCRVA
ncbi:MAG: GNAT family N-acetyltransferase [Gammaproteobacteria bacterium]